MPPKNAGPSSCASPHLFLRTSRVKEVNNKYIKVDIVELLQRSQHVSTAALEMYSYVQYGIPYRSTDYVSAFKKF